MFPAGVAVGENPREPSRVLPGTRLSDDPVGAAGVAKGTTGWMRRPEPPEWASGSLLDRGSGWKRAAKVAQKS